MIMVFRYFDFGRNMEKLAILHQEAMTHTGITVVTLEGVLDINNVDSLENVLRDLLTKRQYRIVLNLEKLTYLSSAGIGVLLSSIKEVRKNGGDIKISNTPPDRK